MLEPAQYYQQSIEHRNTHKCGGYPFAHGEFLTKVVPLLNAHSVLEIGTAIGYSAFCFANENTDAHVTTIDMEPTHEKIAREIWITQEVSDNIDCIVGKSSDVLPTLDTTFDIVFFDGFAPNPDEVKEYVRLLNANGVIMSTNLSWNSTTPNYIDAITSLGLNTQRHDDTAFSSHDEQKLGLCSKLWTELVPDSP